MFPELAKYLVQEYTNQIKEHKKQELFEIKCKFWKHRIHYMTEGVCLTAHSTTVIKSTALNERHSLTELRVICVVVTGEWGDSSAISSHSESTE